MPTDPVALHRAQFTSRITAAKNAIERHELCQDITRTELGQAVKKWTKIRGDTERTMRRIGRIERKIARQPLPTTPYRRWMNDKAKHALIDAEREAASIAERRRYIAAKVVALRRKLYDLGVLIGSLEVEALRLADDLQHFERSLRDENGWRPVHLWQQDRDAEVERKREFNDARLSLGPDWFELSGLEQRLDLIDRYQQY